MHAPSFDVASIKPARPNDPAQMVRRSVGTLTIENLSLADIIKMAYELRSSQELVDVPRWVSTTHYDISAKVGDATAQEMMKIPTTARIHEYNVLLQQLLADRFQMKVSHTTREIPYFVLVVASGGPRMARATSPETKTGDSKELAAQDPAESVGVWPGKIIGKDLSMGSLATLLSQTSDVDDRAVVDKTGLDGRYDLTLNWSSDFKETSSKNEDSTAAGASLFTALEEQLGLKLVSTKGVREVVAVDHIEPPTSN
jgi:uncharacterized protein (TIGR03435 family)